MVNIPLLTGFYSSLGFLNHNSMFQMHILGNRFGNSVTLDIASGLLGASCLGRRGPCGWWFIFLPQNCERGPVDQNRSRPWIRSLLYVILLIYDFMMFVVWFVDGDGNDDNKNFPSNFWPTSRCLACFTSPTSQHVLSVREDQKEDRSLQLRPFW